MLLGFIPYFASPTLHLPLGLQIDAFGILVALALIIGARLATRGALRYGPGNDEPLLEMTPWAIGFGFAGAHFLHVFGYHPELIQQEGWGVVFRFWDGLSSMGGVLGALVGIFLSFRRQHIPVRPYLDALALGTTPGWAVARIGCFLVHDHPGVHTPFPLAVAFSDGPRHDLGLYDFLVLAALSAVLYGLARTKHKEGLLMGVLAVGYSVPRFFLDFLRAQDVAFADGRFFGLTPAQYITPVLFGVGLRLLLAKARVTPLPVPPPPAPVEPPPPAAPA